MESLNFRRLVSIIISPKFEQSPQKCRLGLIRTRWRAICCQRKPQRPKFEDYSNTQSNDHPPKTQSVLDAFEESLDISTLTADEHKLYEYLHARGWNENCCLIYFRDVRAIQQDLVQHFRAQCWSEI